MKQDETTTRGIPVPTDLWDSGLVPDVDTLSQLVYRSNLLGADRTLTNEGGGNTSAKDTVLDHTGRQVRVLWVKGSGTDLATIAGEGFAGLRLDELLLLQDREDMDDATMVAYLLRCGVRPDQPRPSIETLLHAFIPAEHVDHTHPDAIIALTSTPDGKSLAEDVFGDEAVWLDYQRPGFDMSRRLAELLQAQPAAQAVLLERHGLVTWGQTSEETYLRTLEIVGRAAKVIDAAAGAFGLGGPRVHPVSDQQADDLLAAALPALRGALLEDADGVVLEVDRSPEAIAFASSTESPRVSQVGAPCPDHLIHTKHKPLALEFDPTKEGAAELTEAFTRSVADYRAWYRDYYNANVDNDTRQFPIDPAGPRVVLAPGVGVITSGRDARHASLTRDLYHRAIAVQDAAEALGGFRSLSEQEAFAIEYWPLERYKLSQAPPAGELAGRVALITGGASGIGRATARLLAAKGAHIALADLNISGAEALAEELVDEFGHRRAIALPVDVADEAAVTEMTRQTVLAYGGLDILIASAGLATSSPITETTLEEWELSYAVLARGYFLTARETMKIMQAQGAGGSIVFVASKNALVAGADAAAYSSAKAASLHLARCLAEEGGPHGIRVNTVNPDAVIQGSSIWSTQWKDERANTYGVAGEDLQAFYRQRTKLGVDVYPEDVAEAIAFLAGPQAAKTTGNILNVDGGVTAAYPR